MEDIGGFFAGAAEVVQSNPDLNDQLGQAAQFVAEKAVEEGSKIVEGIAKGEITSLKDIEMTVVGDVVGSAKSHSVKFLADNGVDTSVATYVTDKIGNKIEDKSENIIQRDAKDLKPDEGNTDNLDVTPCLGACCLICGLGRCCPFGCRCLLTVFECKCMVCDKEGCCCNCCSFLPVCHCCDGKCVCFHCNTKGLFLDIRAAFPCTALDIVPCMLSALGWTCIYRNECACYCCISLNAMETARKGKQTK